MNYKSYITNEGNVDNDGPDIVYYNMDIISGADNEKQLGGDSNILRFSETRSTPIINNISKYYFSIIRFSMNGPNKDLPLCVLPIKTGPTQTNRNLTNLRMSITMLKSSVPSVPLQTSTRDVIYVSESLDAFTNSSTALPNLPLKNVDRRGVYYWIYSYDHFTKLINTTIADCFKDLQLSYAAAGGTGTIITQPAKLVYNENNKLFEFYFDCNGWSDLGSVNNSLGTGTQEIFKMSFNADLYNLLSNFDYKNVGFTTSSLQYQLQISNKNYKNYVKYGTVATNLIPQPSTAGYMVMSQNYESTSSLWSPISSIVFTSGTIPLVAEGVAAPTIYSDNTNGNTTTNAFQPIITDIALGMDNGASSYREMISYVPSAEYRLSSFTNSNQPLTQIDIQIYWKSRLDLQLYPVAMPAYSSTSIKIMFKKKHLV
jgi:hypothetical protein